MAKTLLLLRHAKSSWKDGTLSDHDRPLKKRGRKDATRVGEFLAKKGMVPDRVVSSTATRAVATAQAVVETCGFSGPLETTRRLYMAPASAYIELIQGFEETCERPLLVGHNPGMEELVAHLFIRPIHMSTAALVAIELPIDHWAQLALPCAGELLHLWRRKDLE